MVVNGFQNSRRDCEFFKWTLLFCLFQFWVDSYRTFGLPSHKAFPRHFTVNNNKWIFRENAKKREYSNKQRENIHGSSVLTAGETHRLLTRLFKLADQEKDEHLSNSFKRQLKKTYHTAKARTKEKPLWQQRAKTSVQLREKITRKDYVFRDITQNEILNSYAVESTPEVDRGPAWYITIVSGVIVLVAVVALCVYAPCGCLWRRHRSEHDVSCPIAGSRKGMCGKCFLHSNATTKTMTYEERPHNVSVTMASNGSYQRPNSGDYSSQYTWAYNTHRADKLSQAKSKVSNLLKGSQGSSHLYEPAAGYRYKPLKSTDKRNSLHTVYDPEWTSVGAFLNKNRPSSSYLGYGSTKESEKKFVDRYCRRSRDSLEAGEEFVEYTLKLRPRRRQVIELQEFPLGYTKSFLNIDLESDPGVVFDPYRDQQLRRKKGRKFDRLTFSDSDLRQLSCTDKLGNYDSTSDLFGAPKPRKSSLKVATTRGKTNAKVVHFFPSNFSYDAQFVQIPPTNKMTEVNVGEFERRFNHSYSGSRETSFEGQDYETIHLPSSKPTISGDVSEFLRHSERTKAVGNYGNMKRASKEHAVDGEATYEGNFTQSRDCASSYVNYGCRSSTEVLTSSKERLDITQGPRSFYGNIDSELRLAKGSESISSSFSDVSKSDQDCKVEPLAGLMSPIRRSARAHHNEGATKEKNEILTSQTAGNWACVSSYIQPLAISNPAAPTVGRSSSQTNIYQSHNTTEWKSSQSELEKDVWHTGHVMPCHEQIQCFPEKDTNSET